MSCPYTSAQNGKAHQVLHSTNNIVHSLLFQASMPPCYWAEALSNATYLFNILPTKTLQSSTPHHALFDTVPSYDRLRVFGCRCYPNLSSTAPHKLSPQSALCVHLGFSDHHKGYRCLDLQSNRIIVSRHVIFDEYTFPFNAQPSAPSPEDYAFLDDFTNPVPLPVGIAPLLSPAGTSGNTALPHVVVPTVSLPLDATSSAVPLLVYPLQAASTARPCAAVPSRLSTHRPATSHSHMRLYHNRLFTHRLQILHSHVWPRCTLLLKRLYRTDALMP